MGEEERVKELVIKYFTVSVFLDIDYMDYMNFNEFKKEILQLLLPKDEKWKILKNVKNTQQLRI